MEKVARGKFERKAILARSGLDSKPVENWMGLERSKGNSEEVDVEATGSANLSRETRAFRVSKAFGLTVRLLFGREGEDLALGPKGFSKTLGTITLGVRLEVEEEEATAVAEVDLVVTEDSGPIEDWEGI